jgi:uncharacterized protein (TIGR04255 family)
MSMIPDLGEGPYPTLRNAPITEALIDIRVQLPNDVNIETLRNIQSVLAPRFPKMDQRMSVEAQLKMDEQGAKLIGPPAFPDGVLLSSETEPLRVQARLDGFTVHRLSPYTKWTTFAADAKELWERYKQTARPAKVTRLGVRYINRLELTPYREFTDFILTVPEIAPKLPQKLADYLMRLVIPDETGSIAVVTQSTVPRDANAMTYPIIFDIDVFRVVELAPDAAEIWSIMEELRNYKNLIFFGSLTPKFLETFK